ncbi:alpha/beta hydrolase [Listeria cossartiae subsp. cayugensis]|uniref:Alpha/beta hydrolase n=1 Tax=Listeria cossartiae subsp. cayugensis TaxID=2713505 RepID=A0ABU2IKG4_9LIST|nr:alpha/beta hydrolase [Listeria cossartiae]MDT0048684.1 alpha/beta hydrolase [Listeria cossartiae subsp. cayugensis]MDT0065187.1 alpha/beta hydrolase [Listeria cossartiae subsp. cayugensis]MDT0079209.1 alpha/beta hydrolase [Listeria cossartiae subsp. cayugensis]MDT0082045.1 alpha/beta hydrolase [Listeria cossartiae subsp. cayugensis]MDT0087420.1 alpha/beta hydrolase [Listeria cossartiae subsp. cayugensis]
MKLWKKITIMISGIVVILVVLLFIGNDYEMTEKRVNIPTTGGDLSVVVTTPKHDKPKGIIVFVHGDGAQEATQNGGYKPLMERFAKQGYISVSWDKLGVGKSSGNWLDQSMDDRANEVNQVIEWMKVKYPDSTTKIGLWGASQAGWVIPKVMNANKDIDFSILAAPAINWMRQGEYNTGAQVKNAGATNKEIIQAKQNFLTNSKLISKNETYERYKQNGGKEEMSSERYDFIRKNMTADATEDLTKVQAKLYLVLAEKDENVDSAETKDVYTHVVKQASLEVQMISNVKHQMINPVIANSELLINVVGLMVPKYFLVDDAYLDYCEKVVSEQ